MYFTIHSILTGETMKKVKLNVASDRTKKLIEYLAELEVCDRDRMSSSGREYMDKIWQLLNLPTYDQIQSELPPLTKPINSNEEEE